MSRDRKFQATTKNVGDLVIGTSRISTGAVTDVNNAAAHGALTSVGALKNATLSMKPTFKEHKAGYPQVLDFKIAELLSATYKAEMEEVGSTQVMDFLDKALDTLETGTPHYYGIEALSEFASGGTLSLFTPYAQLKPTISLNFTDDFNAIPFEFEALANPAGGFVNKDLIYRVRTNAAARSVLNQPMTKDVNDLSIGLIQVRIGKPSRRQSGVAKLYSAKLVELGPLAITGTRPVVTSSGNYTGLVDGAFIVKITDNTTDSLTIDWWGPTDDPTQPAPGGQQDVEVSGTTLLGSGVSIAFADELTVNNAIGDVYVIGVETGSALALTNTGISCPYSYLTSVDRIGSCKSASLDTNPTFKDHFSGFPKVRDMLMLESSTITTSAAIEEIDASTSALSKGYATTLYDMLFDGSVNGNLYYVPVEIVINLATGHTLGFWMPNAQLAPEADWAPGNDWASLPVKFEAQLQGALNPTKRIYRSKYHQSI